MRESLSGVASVETVKAEVKRYKLRKQTLHNITYSQTPALHACAQACAFVQGDTHSTSGHVTGRKPVPRINDETHLVLLTVVHACAATETLMSTSVADVNAE